MDPHSPVARRDTIEVRCDNGTVYLLHYFDELAEWSARSTLLAERIGSASGIVNATGDPEHVGVLVSYVLKGRLPALLCVADAIAILELADLYGADGLLAHCAKWLQYEVSEGTALRVLVAVTRVGVGIRAAMRAATLLGRALGAVMHTSEFLDLDAGEVERVLCHPAMVPLVKQLRLLAWLKWAAHANRALPPAAMLGLEGLPVTVAGAMLQRADVQERKGLVRAIGRGLGVEPEHGMRSNEIDFALLVFDANGRVFAIDLRTRETHEMPRIPRAWGGSVAAVYDHGTGTAFVFGLDYPVDPYEYFTESGFSRRIPTPDDSKKRAAYVCHDGYVYCIGGSTSEHEYTSTVARMSTRSGGRWEPCASMLVPRSSHDAAVVYSKTGACIVAVGGTEGECAVERLDLSCRRGWGECDVGAPPLHARSIAAVDGEVYVVGGHGALVLDVDDGSRIDVDEIVAAPCQRAVAVEDGQTSHVWVFEACSGEGPNVQVYDPVTRTREDLRVPEYTLGSAVVFVSRAAPGR